MVDSSHLTILESGNEAINHWIEQNPGKSLDLSRAELSRRTIRERNFSGANCKDASFYYADVDGSKFVNANLEKACFLGGSAMRADFSKANLYMADMRASFLTRANFSDASLHKSNLFAANMTYTDCTNAKITNADATSVNFAASNLTNTDFSYTELLRTVFDSSSLAQTDFSNALMIGTIFVDCDLSSCKGLDTVKHDGSSSIDYASISKTFNSSGKTLSKDFSKFLASTGLPREFIEHIPKIICTVKYKSCFISYGQPDKQFAGKLSEALISRGVNCWIYALDLTPGEITWNEISKKRRTAEKMILLCSIKSLMRDGVKKEIEEQIDEDEDKIIPISLDNDWKDSGFEVKRGGNDLKPFLLRRNYADFSKESEFAEALTQLIKALRVDEDK